MCDGGKKTSSPDISLAPGMGWVMYVSALRYLCATKESVAMLRGVSAHELASQPLKAKSRNLSMPEVEPYIILAGGLRRITVSSRL